MLIDNCKENFPLNKICTPRHNRKYSYAGQFQQVIATAPHSVSKQKQTYKQPSNPQQYIHQLEEELAQEKLKCKRIQQHTIRQQTKVLQQINILEIKFNEVEQQKAEMQQLLQQSYAQIQQYKKVKGIADAMVNMMQKVEGRGKGDYHDAWRWVKRVVQQHQNIKSKGLEWKKAYDQMRKLEREKNNTFSNQSSDSFQQDQ